MAGKYGDLWSRDELILALYLYCQIPFAQTRANNPEVIRLAHLIGRTPSSVARKLGNFGAFDPVLAAQGITGLVHYSKADRAVWEEFSQHWDALVTESQRLLDSAQSIEVPSPDEEPIIARPSGSSERSALVAVRLHQAFFRKAVLSSYDYTCCVCAIDLPQLLIASHIVPWSVLESARTDPQNGLCLCALHDRALDRGLLSVSATQEIMITRSVLASEVKFVRITLASFEGKMIKSPRRFAPSKDYLDWHGSNVFRT